MPKRMLLATLVLALAGSTARDVAQAQSPPIRIASMRLADQDGKSCGRRCRFSFMPRANEQVFLLTALENTTGQSQSYSLGRNYDGSGVSGGGTGSIDPMRRSLLADGGGTYTPGIHTVVVTLCTIESFPCGDGVNDELLDQVTFQFNVRQ